MSWFYRSLFLLSRVEKFVCSFNSILTLKKEANEQLDILHPFGWLSVSWASLCFCRGFVSVRGELTYPIERFCRKKFRFIILVSTPTEKAFTSLTQHNFSTEAYQWKILNHTPNDLTPKWKKSEFWQKYLSLDKLGQRLHNITWR